MKGHQANLRRTQRHATAVSLIEHPVRAARGTDPDAHPYRYTSDPYHAGRAIPGAYDQIAGASDKRSSPSVNCMQNVARWARLPRNRNKLPECGYVARHISVHMCWA
jgi:hypothetical protein